MFIVTVEKNMIKNENDIPNKRLFYTFLGHLQDSRKPKYKIFERGKRNL